MRELRRRDDVADRVDAVDARAHVAVDDDEAALVDLDARARRARCSRSAAGGRRDTTTLSTGELLLAVLALEAHRADRRRSRATCTPVCTLMPRFVNARTTVCATCWSTPARTCGSASRIVTSAPTSTRNDANSQPIAPPPIDRDARRAPRSSCSTWSDDSTRVPSNSKPSTASARGDEPVAISTLRPRTSVPSETRSVRPSGVEHARCRGRP